MQHKTYPNTSSQPNLSKTTGKSQKLLFQDSQPNQQANYVTYLSTLSLGALQKQLQTVREKQKQFYKLNYELKMLEKKSHLVSEQSRKFSQTQSEAEDDEIAQLKAAIQGVNKEIKNITQEAKQVKKHCNESKQHLKLLQDELEKVKNQNYKILQQVNEKKTKLREKTLNIQELKESQLQNHKKITILRQEIKSLEKESHLLENELIILTEQKETKQKNKQKLTKIISELQKQLIYQKDHERQTQIKLSHIKTQKVSLQKELISLRKEEESKIQEYQRKLQEYHNVCALNKESEMKRKSLEDELMVVENDIQELNLQFISEGELLTKEQQQNTAINEEFDFVTKEAIDVWHSICDLIKIQEQQESSAQNNHNLIERKSSKNQIKFKALKVWKQIQDIIKINDKE